MNEQQDRIAADAAGVMDPATACSRGEAARAAASETAASGARDVHSRRALSGVGVLLSLAFHGGVLAAGLAWAKTESGAVAEQSEAISIEMTLTSVIEAADDSPVPDAAASEATAAAREGNWATTETAAVPAAEIEPAPPPLAEVEVVEPDAVSVPPPQGLEVIEGSHGSEEATGHTAGDPQPKEPPKANNEQPREDEKSKRQAEKQPKLERDQSKDKQRTAALQEGGVTARARSGSVASSGRVSASKGNLVDYKQRVNARVAGNKPGGSSGRGTATVSFGVTASGSLSYARLSRSSGSAALDAAAVAAVRRSGPFGPTPTGGSLSFSFSFYFR